MGLKFAHYPFTARRSIIFRIIHATAVASDQTWFDGTLGDFQFEADFELKEGTKPSAQRPHRVAQAHYKALRKEIDRFCKIGVLRKCSPSEWASPSFVIPKKNKRIRVVSDFHKLNKSIKRKPFPFPRIQETLPMGVVGGIHRFSLLRCLIKTLEAWSQFQYTHRESYRH